MNTYEIIKKKRDGFQLTTDEIEFLIHGLITGEISDYQISAFLMAVYFRGMNPRECVDLTKAMVASGDIVDLSDIKGFKVDKHSTGGVGDTTTLVLAPLVAACGGIVPKMSGRELGHTGGTVDKLESIPGMQVELSKEKFVEIVNRNHVCIIAQTARLAPADKIIYALRNVTATVDSIPLIASSIMSKKLAAGADGIVLDVKTGTGAFMPRYEDALELSKTMVEIGEGAGKRVVAVITSMEQPLGYAVGNAVEVKEAIDTLNGIGPEDLEELVMELGSNMLLISGVAATRQQAIDLLQAGIKSKNGISKLKKLISLQEGDDKAVDDIKLLPQPRMEIEIESRVSGYVEAIDALEVGLASKILGAGRHTKDDPVDLSVGIVLKKKVGDRVEKGKPLAVFFSNGDLKKTEPAKEKFLNAYTIGENQVKPPRFFHARVTKDGVEEL